MFMLSEDENWFRVRLSLMGDNLPVEEIESRLGLPTDYFGRKGEHVDGNPRRAKHETNIWVSQYLTSPGVPFEEQIAVLLDRLETEAAVLKEILSLPNVEGEVSESSVCQKLED